MERASAAALGACPSFVAAMDVVGKRWSGLIIGAIANGCYTFSDISRYAPSLSDAVLARRLRELEVDGLLTRVVKDARPPSVRYHLSESGQALAPILDQLTAWGQDYLGVPAAGSSTVESPASPSHRLVTSAAEHLESLEPNAHGADISKKETSR